MKDQTNSPIPTNSPEIFGEPTQDGRKPLSVIDALSAAPTPDPERKRPTVIRQLQADGGNLITFSFAPGQSLPDHRAAHPIMVQCIAGILDFGCEEHSIRLEPGRVVHLNDHVVHRVDCPEHAPETNVLLLTMLTGERLEP